MHITPPSVFLWSLLLILLLGCAEERSSALPEAAAAANWDHRRMAALPHNLVLAGSYLAVYSEIYSRSEARTLDLTATVSLRNISSVDSVFVSQADYYNTSGKRIRQYIDAPVFIAPLETIEIVIDKKDREGGSGANFIFQWAIRPGASEPLFEAVMISTEGCQGISFTTQGIKR